MATIDESQIEEDVYYFLADQKDKLPTTKNAIKEAARREMMDFVEFEEQDGGEPVTDAQIEEYQRIWIRVYKRVTAHKVEETDAFLQSLGTFDAAELGKTE